MMYMNKTHEFEMLKKDLEERQVRHYKLTGPKKQRSFLESLLI